MYELSETDMDKKLLKVLRYYGTFVLGVFKLSSKLPISGLLSDDTIRVTHEFVTPDLLYKFAVTQYTLIKSLLLTPFSYRKHL